MEPKIKGFDGSVLTNDAFQRFQLRSGAEREIISGAAVFQLCIRKFALHILSPPCKKCRRKGFFGISKINLPALHKKAYIST